MNPRRPEGVKLIDVLSSLAGIAARFFTALILTSAVLLLLAALIHSLWQATAGTG